MDEDRPRSAWRLDPGFVDAFVAGDLTDAEEAALADEIARLLPFHAELPHPVARHVSTLLDHVGGDAGLWAWLDRHPGRPRVVARLYRIMALLDRVSAEPGVVTALAELRERTPYPPGLEGHLVPDTTIETLAGLSGRIELLLGEDQLDEAVRVADAAVRTLAELAPRAAELQPELAGLRDEVEQARRVLAEATG
ncbi:MAG TPA: hypothetical protein VGP02_03295 [Mycobacteriales bacterium]|jgi:hypothetical protein|nr:hypothetical protein [Mycobacteriales bacterium]